MTLKGFYDEIGGDYEGVFDRIGSEELIVKYLKKFRDSDMLGKFSQSAEEGDCKEAFRHMHSLKGLCLNLGLNELFKSVDVVCEALRDKTEVNLSGLPMDELKTSYDEVLNLTDEL